MVGITTATIIVLLYGGGDIDHYLTDINKGVKKNIEDKARREIILDESKDLGKALKSLTKEVEQHVEEVIHVHADFHSGEADFDAATAKLVDDQAKATQLILDAREVMRAQTTRKEWEAIFKPE